MDRVRLKASRFHIKLFTEVPVEEKDGPLSLLTKMGLVRQVSSGIYCLLPVGVRITRKLGCLIKFQMNSIGSSEMSLPVLQPLSLWQRSGRAKKYGAELFCLEDRTRVQYILGPTAEELVADILKQYAFSSEQLPVFVYQLGPKFRDEVRPRFSTIRAREFEMKDCYSFDSTERNCLTSYQLMTGTYKRIFGSLNLRFQKVIASGNQMGGPASHEFLAFTSVGTEMAGRLVAMSRSSCQNLYWTSEMAGQSEKYRSVTSPQRKRRATEVGHIFQLGRHYSSASEATFQDGHSIRQPLVMGCYGIGVTRLLGVIVNQKYDCSNGIMIWPPSVTPFSAVIIPMHSQPDAQARSSVGKLHSALRLRGDVLLEDGPQDLVTMVSDWDFVGTAFQLMVGSRVAKEGTIVLQSRDLNGLSVVPMLWLLVGIAGSSSD